MDTDFGDDFGEMTPPKVDVQHTSYNSNNDTYKKNDNYKKKPKRNLIGVGELNLWDKPTIEPEELDTDAMDDSSKIFTIALPNIEFKLSDEKKKNIVEVLKLLKKKGFKARFVVDHVYPIYDELKEIFGKDNLIHVIPFGNYKCEVEKDTILYVATDANIKAAAYYIKKKNDKGKNFDELPIIGQFANAASVGALFGYENKTPSEYLITFDPFISDGKNIDFVKSRFTGNYFILSRKLPFTTYNLAKESEYADLEQILL